MRELSRNGISVFMDRPYKDYVFKCPEGTVLEDYFAPPMLRVLHSPRMQNFFRAALVARANKCEPLICPDCEQSQIAASSSGTASATKKCGMTPGCKGKLGRIRPPVFDLVMPKRKRRPRSDP